MIRWFATPEARFAPPPPEKESFNYKNAASYVIDFVSKRERVSGSIEWDDRKFRACVPLDEPWRLKGVSNTWYVLQAANEEEYLQLKADYVFHRLST